MKKCEIFISSRERERERERERDVCDCVFITSRNRRGLHDSA